MGTNQEGNAEKFFKDFGKRLDQFTVELKDAGSRLEIDFQKKYEELKVVAKKFQAEAGSKKHWQEVEEGLKRAGKEMEHAFKKAFGKKSSS